MDSVQRIGRLPDESFDRFCVKRVYNQWNDFAVCFLGNHRGRVAQQPLIPGSDSNVAAFTCQLVRYCFAHTSAATGDDCLFALKLKIHTVSFEDSFRLLLDVQSLEALPAHRPQSPSLKPM